MKSYINNFFRFIFIRLSIYKLKYYCNVNKIHIYIIINSSQILKNKIKLQSVASRYKKIFT